MHVMFIIVVIALTAAIAMLSEIPVISIMIIISRRDLITIMYHHYL